MRAALLLIDLQHDFLERPGLTPPVAILARRVGELLDAFRASALPILHVRTLVRPDGANRMPHWKRADYRACVEGTRGADAPPELDALPSERILAKSYFSAFGNPETEQALRQLGIDTLVISGIYTHGCVRATILDAYQAGYEVWTADEAVASTDPLHASLTRAHLGERACRFMTNREILARLGLASAPDAARDGDELLPVGCVDGAWQAADGQDCFARHDPANWNATLAVVPIGNIQDIRHATAAAAARQTTWGERVIRERAGLLGTWATILAERRQEFVALMAREVGKPTIHGLAEFHYAMSLLEAAAERAMAEKPESCAPDVKTRRCPLGVVGLITPWNNPLAIAVGKLAPALAYGNCVVWKPALEAPRLAMLIMETLRDAGMPPGCVNLIHGDADTGQHLLTDPRIAAISFTGRVETGRQIAGVCAAQGKTLQAELGGNNAALVMEGCDIAATAKELADAAYRFSGQSCTAPRRLIVEKRIRHEFEHALIKAISSLKVGDPENPDTYIGPLVSEPHRERIHAMRERAVLDGARVLYGGCVPPGLSHGCWYEPTLIADPDPRSPLVQEESFGPLVLLMEAGDMEEALKLCNDVRHGLVATLYSPDPEQKARFLNEARAGILRINHGLIGIHPDAPFCGWKASGIGPPEHGYGDREFYSRVQAVYERS